MLNSKKNLKFLGLEVKFYIKIHVFFLKLILNKSQLYFYKLLY